MIRPRSAFLVILAGLLFAGMSATVKYASSTLSNEMVVFFRNALGLLVLLPLVGWRGISLLRTNCLHLHLLRAVAGLAAMYCFFYAIAHMRLADAVLLNYTLPLFMPFIARIWLGEEILPRVRWAIVLGFVGVAFILKPGSGLIQTVALVGLSAGMLGALAQVTIRRLTKTESITRVVFYFGVIATLISAAPVAGGTFSLPLSLWLVLLLMGILATAAQLLLTRGYADAPASQVGPFIYSSVVFAALFDWMFWGDVPDAYSLIGTFLVCLGGILTIVRGRIGFRRRLTIDV